MFRRVLVPIDGSLGGYDLAERAIELAATFEADLYLVLIERLSTSFTLGGLVWAPTDATPGVDDTEAAIEYVADRAGEAGVDCRQLTKRGERHLAILHAAKDCRADLIVLQSPERRLWRRLPITTADRVYRQASAAVITLDP